jgi:hypothetical protein
MSPNGDARARRLDWQARTVSARAFLADVKSSAGLVSGVRHACKILSHADP